MLAVGACIEHCDPDTSACYACIPGLSGVNCIMSPLEIVQEIIVPRCWWVTSCNFEFTLRQVEHAIRNDGPN